ncbi:MAG: GNAT family N-acetyltransferase [Acidimicrobiales bacterium]
MPEYIRYQPSEADDLVDLLCGDRWPFHPDPTPDPSVVLGRIREGHFDTDATAVTFWVIDGGERVGLLRAFDLDEPTPMFDIRIRTEMRGRRYGKHAVAFLTAWLFSSRPEVRRVEATTRVDNRAMRRVLRRCGYAKEAHYRDAWDSPGGELHDAVGYAILRRDWEAGATTPVDFADEPG